VSMVSVTASFAQVATALGVVAIFVMLDLGVR
jgi:hypothetical protein